MNIIQIQNRVQELPNTPQTMQYLNAALNGQVRTVPPYIAAAELKRRETEGMMDQLAKGAAQGPQPTVKDQLEQKMGIMALMGQQQPPQRPQIPQPEAREPQPEAAGIDSLPVKEEMFGMAGGGIVAFNGETGSYAGSVAKSIEEWLRSVYEGAENAPIRGRGIPQDVQERRAAAAKEEQARRDALAKDFTKGIMEEAAASRPASQPTGARPPGVRPSGPRPPVNPAAAPGATTSLADLAPAAPSRTLEDALGADPAYKKMQALMGNANPYAGPQESQADYIQRIRQGILSQIPGGKAPWETSEARLKELEGRRAREDAEYEAMTKGEGRRLDNLLTFISGMGPGSFGRSGAQGIQTLQKVEREQAAEALKRKDMRDQQAMKLMEIRALNDQAQFAEATGNVKEYERLQQEIKKLKNEFDVKQADIAKDVGTLGAGARAKDVEAAEARAKLREESRQKELERQKDVQVARIQAAARASGRSELTPAQAAKLRADAVRDVDKALEKAPFKERQAAKDPAVREELIRKRMEIIFQQGYTSGEPSPGTPAGGSPEGWGKASVVKP